MSCIKYKMNIMLGVKRNWNYLLDCNVDKQEKTQCKTAFFRLRSWPCPIQIFGKPIPTTISLQYTESLTSHAFPIYNATALATHPVKAEGLWHKHINWNPITMNIQRIIPYTSRVHFDFDLTPGVYSQIYIHTSGCQFHNVEWSFHLVPTTYELKQYVRTSAICILFIRLQVIFVFGNREVFGGKDRFVWFPV